MKVKKGMLMRIKDNELVMKKFRNLEVEISEVYEDRVLMIPLVKVPGLLGELACEISKVDTHLEHYAKNKSK